MSVAYSDVYHHIGKAYQVLEHAIQLAVADFDLTVTQFQMLEAIARGRASSPAQCSRAINLTPSGMTHIIDKLERRGLVNREREEGDRRFITIRLMPEGESLYRRAAKAVSKSWNDVVGNLPSEELAWLNTGTAR
jgi:DNA-binding MarR family transcriptional regulator